MAITLRNPFRPAARNHETTLSPSPSGASGASGDDSPGFDTEGLPPLTLITHLLHEHAHSAQPRYRRLWDYYRNPMRTVWGLRSSTADAGRGYQLAQEQGLPPRLRPPSAIGGASPSKRDVVIENDIAWRIHTLVDFMFGKPVILQSCAAGDRSQPGATLPGLIESLLRRALDLAGGAAFLQDLALLGAVYGQVDLLLRVDGDALARVARTHARSVGEAAASPAPASVAARALEAMSLAAACMSIEIIESPRAVPLLNARDYRRLDAYLVTYRLLEPAVEPPTLASRVTSAIRGERPDPRRVARQVVEVWTPDARFELAGDDSAPSLAGRGLRVVARHDNPLGRIPIVHIQNLPQPYAYEGLSEVEPLIPLQDELNTRLSDRANRVTFQSFKMYLGKGIDGFLDRPVGPGQMWATDGTDATIEEFGGDSACPSEDAHIADIREAMDKASSVTSIAVGVLRDRIGNLSSENALRVALTGLLARTHKKRLTYGAGLQQLCDFILDAVDRAGLLATTHEQRRVRLDWPSPLPDDTDARLAQARAKLDLGVPRHTVLAELGYGDVANPDVDPA